MWKIVVEYAYKYIPNSTRENICTLKRIWEAFARNGRFRNWGTGNKRIMFRTVDIGSIR